MPQQHCGENSTDLVGSYNEAIAEAGGEQITIQDSIEETLAVIDNLIAECESNDPARREYVITEAGMTAVEKEIHRLEEMLSNAQKYYKEGR